MIDQLLAKARDDQPIFITELDLILKKMADVIHLTLELERIDGSYDSFIMDLPGEYNLEQDTLALMNDYVCARIYNILSSLGGRCLRIYFDAEHIWLAQIIDSLDNRFGIGKKRKDRTGYGKCINVIDRMLEHIDEGQARSQGFCFIVNPMERKPNTESGKPMKPVLHAIDKFRSASLNLAGKIICGIDVGGTDIKVAAADNGEVRCFKEYDWFPAEFTEARQIIDPILLLIRLVRAQLSLSGQKHDSQYEQLERNLTEAMDRSCLLERMEKLIDHAESVLGKDLIHFDSIGLCFPDVVVKNKIIGGEVYKTRGIRNNPAIDYESEFAMISDLDLNLQKFCKPDGHVHMTNDGPMAAFTAAVEQAVSTHPKRVADGIFAHTLGTELGTGWIDESGSIPDIPLEVYNFIIDLGSFDAKQFHCDDLRSINNFNTDLAGTLQKYASQSGAFRLAIKYFKQDRPDLYQDMVDQGFIVTRNHGNQTDLLVPTEPIDLRKPFLQYLMDLADRKNDPACDQIFISIGKFLAVTWAETELILKPKTKSRILFGRLVKNARCFELILQGARELIPNLFFGAADGSIANTSLMKQLDADPVYTIAQFGQAIGAIYFGNVQE